jgi:hypothetical protein
MQLQNQDGECLSVAENREHEAETSGITFFSPHVSRISCKIFLVKGGLPDGSKMGSSAVVVPIPSHAGNRVVR